MKFKRLVEEKESDFRKKWNITTHYFDNCKSMPDAKVIMKDLGIDTRYNGKLYTFSKNGKEYTFYPLDNDEMNREGLERVVQYLNENKRLKEDINMNEDEITEDAIKTFDLIDDVFAYEDNTEKGVKYKCYVVKVVNDRKQVRDDMTKYFYTYESAKKYYDEMIKELKEDSFTYEWFRIYIIERIITIENEQQDYETIYNEDEE